MTAISFMAISWSVDVSCTLKTSILAGFPLWQPTFQVATLAQLDAQLRASQTDFWGMWGSCKAALWEMMGDDDGGPWFMCFLEISLQRSLGCFFGGW